MTAGAYLTAMGPDGLREAASQCCSKAHYLAAELAKIGYTRVYDRPFFHEFVTVSPEDPKTVEKKLAAKGILGGLPMGDKILWCATEMNTKAEIDGLIAALKGDE